MRHAAGTEGTSALRALEAVLFGGGAKTDLRGFRRRFLGSLDS